MGEGSDGEGWREMLRDGIEKKDEEKTKAKENKIGEGKRNGCCEG